MSSESRPSGKYRIKPRLAKLTPDSRADSALRAAARATSSETEKICGFSDGLSKVIDLYGRERKPNRHKDAVNDKLQPHETDSVREPSS